MDRGASERTGQMGKKRGDDGVQRTLCVAPSGEFEGIEMINGGEGEEFVQRCYHVVVLDIGQTADMQDEMPESIEIPQLDSLTPPSVPENAK